MMIDIIDFGLSLIIVAAFVTVVVLISGPTLYSKFKILQRERLMVRARNAILTQDIQRLEKCECKLLEILTQEMSEFFYPASPPITSDFVKVQSDVYDTLIRLKKSKSVVQSNTQQYPIFLSHSDDARLLWHVSTLLKAEKIPIVFDDTDGYSSPPVMWNEMLTTDVALFIIDGIFLTSTRRLRELLVFGAKERARWRELTLEQTNMVIVMPEPRMVDTMKRSPIGQVIASWPSILTPTSNESTLTFIQFEVLPAARALIGRHRPAKTLLVQQIVMFMRQMVMFVNEEFDVPIAKCLQYQVPTREGVIKSMTHPAKGNVAVLIGDAGVGKSVVMAEIVYRGSKSFREQLGDRRQGDDRIISSEFNVGAFHFFTHASGRFRNWKIGIISLAAQLCDFDEEFEKALSKLISNYNETSFGKYIEGESDPTVLLRKLIIEPANALVRCKCTALVIDALDECDDSVKLAQALQKVWKDAPIWFILLLSSRDVQLNLEDNVTEVRLSQEDNVRDVRMYIDCLLSKRLKVADEAEHQRIATQLSNKASGSFLWISCYESLLDQTSNESLSLMDDLEQQQLIAKRLRGVYFEYFTQLRREFDDDDDMFYSVVAMVLLVPRDPLPETLWREAIGLGDTKDSSYNKVKKAARTLFVFAANGTVNVSHKSMRDCIQGLCSDELYYRGNIETFLEGDVTMYHRQLGNVLEKLFHRRMMVEDTEVDCSANGTTAVSGATKVRSMGNYSLEEAYMLRNVVYHWIQAHEIDEAAKWYLDMHRLIRLVDQVRQDDGDISKIILECHEIIKLIERMPKPFHTLTKSRLELCLSLLDKCKDVDTLNLPLAMGKQAWELPPSDTTEHFVIEAKKWHGLLLVSCLSLSQDESLVEDESYGIDFFCNTDYI